jgi:hypothetical protein
MIDLNKYDDSSRRSLGLLTPAQSEFLKDRLLILAELRAAREENEKLKGELVSVEQWLIERDPLITEIKQARAALEIISAVQLKGMSEMMIWTPSFTAKLCRLAAAIRELGYG